MIKEHINPLAQATKTLTVALSVALMIGFLLVVWQFSDRIYTQFSEWHAKVTKYDELEAANVEYAALVEQLQLDMVNLQTSMESTVSLYNALYQANQDLMQETRDAKDELRKKDIAGNAPSWIQNDPFKFRESVTDGSSRVLTWIEDNSQGIQGSGASGGSDKNNMPVANNPKTDHPEGNGLAAGSR